ncbi:hypothetical protein JQN72_03940 [Phycicoccus sp. CSK15P-2]|uniref:hypothetical protein n=1 Tax=Phycicoccus sp. CSK15P-2 TaxID=2807627 RepID=UPI00194E036D|nr:hypothetical protein [Phycicoccus sp. CSK15P-2]MBM6403393.1 hypothetical protein [Phycicoccus sp. CSK15P-2]
MHHGGFGATSRRAIVAAGLAAALLLGGCGVPDRLGSVARALRGGGTPVDPRTVLSQMQDAALRGGKVEFQLDGELATGGGYLDPRSGALKADVWLPDVGDLEFLLLDGHAYRKDGDPWDADWYELDARDLPAMVEVDPAILADIWSEERVLATALEDYVEAGIELRRVRLVFPDPPRQEPGEDSGDREVPTITRDLHLDTEGRPRRIDIWYDRTKVETIRYHEWDAAVEIVAPPLAPVPS